MIEHEAHIGPEYHSGIDGQKVAIVGYSHWGDVEEDNNSGTQVCVRNVMSGKWRIRFFTQIRGYFQFTDHTLFWNRVMFFNFLPDCVGGPNERFGHGTPEQRKRGQERFLRLICAERPHKVFVFTKRWWAFPDATTKDKPLDDPFSSFCQRTYRKEDLAVPAFLLRHPLGANGELMRSVVSHIRTLPIMT